MAQEGEEEQEERGPCAAHSLVTAVKWPSCGREAFEFGLMKRRPRQPRTRGLEAIP